MDARETKASLGCGSLILIAIIVLIFSGGRDDKKLRSELRSARNEIRALRGEVIDQSVQLDKIQKKLDQQAEDNQRLLRLLPQLLEVEGR
ncbi:hypothetical protein [Luteolibacter marinus]|uniref:hypothetical protein n=1 Tax=Luteolibacter marinus TaxID=2776705 RepID=UPI0018695F47|nr:hypothetical protein [Luteolibacter marinus]